MEDNELLSVLKNFLGKKTTFKELAEIFGFEINFLIDEINRLEQEEKLKYLPLGDGKIRIGEIFDKSKIKSANLKQKKQTTRMIKISCTNWNNCKGATEKSKKNYEGLIFRMSSNALLKIIISNTEIKCPVCFSEVKYDKYSLPLSSNGETIIYQKRID